jgi:Cu/Ag efflux protein CusF
MKIAKILSAGAAALAILSSAALAQQAAQQARTGTITEINRLNGTIAIRPTQSGTVGANAGGASEEFKVQGGMSLDTFHAGDRVTFTSGEGGGTKTITKLQKQ